MFVCLCACVRVYVCVCVCVCTCVCVRAHLPRGIQPRVLNYIDYMDKRSVWGNGKLHCFDEDRMPILSKSVNDIKDFSDHIKNISFFI